MEESDFKTENKQNDLPKEEKYKKELEDSKLYLIESIIHIDNMEKHLRLLQDEIIKEMTKQNPDVTSIKKNLLSRYYTPSVSDARATVLRSVYEKVSLAEVVLHLRVITEKHLRAEFLLKSLSECIKSGKSTEAVLSDMMDALI